MHIDPTVIFAFAGASTVLFAVVGKRGNQLWWAWAVLGGLMGLVVATTTIGLAHAVAIPYTKSELSRCYLTGGVVGTVMLAAIAAGVVFRMARQRDSQQFPQSH